MLPTLHQVSPPDLALTGRAVRRIILEQSMRARVGHIGSALSIADLIAVLYRHVLKIEAPDDPARDRFVLAKGHAALAMYAAFYLRGWLSTDQLMGYCGKGTYLGVHPEHGLDGVDFSTGSLGMGLGYAAGAALAARLQKSPRRAFALLSDAECNEGSVWEAAMFASHHQLSNLTAVIDCNGQQALGYTKDVMQQENLADRWASFGWDVHVVDGHDESQLQTVFDNLDYQSGPPHLILARTVCGKGVSFMERQVKWHYWPLSADEFQLAINELEEVQS